MGTEVCRAVSAAPDLELAGALDVGDDRAAILAAGAQVAVDFTTPDAVMDNLRWCIEHGVCAVVGTTGFDADRLDTVRSWLAAAPDVGVVVAPNFGIGAVLRRGRDRRAAPRRQGGRAQRHRPADRRAGGRRPPRRRARGGAGRHHDGAARRPRRDGGRGASALGPPRRPRCAPGGAARRDRGDADHPARLAGPGLVHARRTARRSRHGRPARADRGTRAAARSRLIRPVFSARRTAIGLAAVLACYLVLVGYRGVLLIGHGGLVPVLLGIGVLGLPVVGAAILVQELRFGRDTERLGRELADAGGLPVDDLARRPSGRVDRAAADALFADRKAEVEAAPADWRSWYRLALAYGHAGDSGRGRRAMRRAIALHRGARR